jgi:hypothetical protein
MSDNFDSLSFEPGDLYPQQPDSLYSKLWAKDAQQAPGDCDFHLSHKLGDYGYSQPDSLHSEVWAEELQRAGRDCDFHLSHKLGDHGYSHSDSLHSEVWAEEAQRIPKKLLTPTLSSQNQEAKRCTPDSLPRVLFALNRQTNTRIGTTCDDGLREHRRNIYEHVKQQWDIGESLVTFTGGALAADKVLSKMPRTTAIERLTRDQRIAGASVSALAASAIDYTADRIVFPRDQKMEGTIIADWFIGTGIALTGLSFKPKLAAMLAVHAIGRCVDHFRQPEQDF